jgi:hypothetical protein
VTPVDTSSDAAYEQLVSRKWLFAWRCYLTFHLFVVVATAVAMTASRADYIDRGTWRDAAIELGPFLFPLAVIGFPLAYAAPIVIVVLLVQAGTRGSHYAVAALMEFALMPVHFYALLPAVQ